MPLPDLVGDGKMNSRAPSLAGPPIEGGAGGLFWLHSMLYMIIIHGAVIVCCAEMHHEL